MGLEQAIEPCGPCSGIGWRAGDDGDEFDDRTIDGAADRAGRAVDVLQRRRDALEQRDRALRCKNWFESRDLLDLGECLLEPRDGGL
jgi:hypothetical protein